MKTLDFRQKRILITIKAYPRPSYSYGETVCCAGIDVDSQKWIRLFPIDFRDLDSNKKFRKYSIIEAACARPSDDPRPESHRIREDSIRILDYIDTTPSGWERRKSIVFSLPTKTLCELKRDEEKGNTSLGLIKPFDNTFKIRRRPLEDPEKRKDKYAQLGFFKKHRAPIEEIPFNFYVHFNCGADQDCSGHELSIIDWEIMQAYRDWQKRYHGEEVLLDKIKERWCDLLNADKRDVFFYVGNQLAHPKSFMILGIFSPSLKRGKL